MNGPFFSYAIPIAEAMLAALSLWVFLFLVFAWAVGSLAGKALGWSCESLGDRSRDLVSLPQWRRN